MSLWKTLNSSSFIPQRFHPIKTKISILKKWNYLKCKIVWKFSSNNSGILRTSQCGQLLWELFCKIPQISHFAVFIIVSSFSFNRKEQFGQKDSKTYCWESENSRQILVFCGKERVKQKVETTVIKVLENFMLILCIVFSEFAAMETSRYDDEMELLGITCQL